ncbi:hypothetical protein JZ751_003106 [Albula glossodonta]|uniref:Uncharacterized protein n=1 Tax=Albula glossodonta TaxID=121402 RepID=A0A8T2NGH1_9TELE|nr:hypothetical protein JZ751_003106 [Albula glossodonta]
MGTQEMFPLRVVLVLPGHNAGVKWRRRGCRALGQREYLSKGLLQPARCRISHNIR